MANRYVAFGYEITDGKLTIIEKEREVVENIFAMYINKLSYIEIADRMNEGRVSYNNDGRQWNKNMVKRLLENEKYIGRDGYPQIISETTFENVKALRDTKYVAASEQDKELNDIYKSTLVCAKCGRPLKRYNGPKRNGKRVEYYKCFNDDCISEGITINRLKLNSVVTDILNEMIREYNPPKIDIENEIVQSEEETELSKEIADGIENNAPDVLGKICKLAEMRFDLCDKECMDSINEKIKRELCIRAEKNKIDTKLLKYLAKKIILSKDQSIKVELINGDIREGRVRNGCECSI